MHSRYEYGRDVRSDKKYEYDNYFGKYNQVQAAKQFLIDKKINENVSYDIEFLEEEDFGREDSQINNYQPDCKLITPYGKYWIEIKVQMKPPNEDVHIKRNQIDKLVKLNGYVLYSMKKMYFIHSARWLKKNSFRIAFSQRLHKECYIIDSNIIKWVYWLHTPEYKDYYKDGNYTSKQKGKR
jgi:hypothetical protein